ncbi:unnamed protein product, partial [Mesorhabditis belari]|uniref:Uncharacterized protein n=1 Tax=Mesorhabditis belari TaxID=2138241 RepID=A0AAF3EL71_9BILA
MNHKHHHPQHGLPNPSVPIFQHGQVFVPNAMDGPPQYGWTGSQSCGMSNMMGGPPIMGSTPVMGTPMMMGAPMMGMGVPMGAPMMGATPIMGPPMGTPVIAAPIMFMPFWRRVSGAPF